MLNNFIRLIDEGNTDPEAWRTAIKVNGNRAGEELTTAIVQRVFYPKDAVALHKFCHMVVTVINRAYEQGYDQGRSEGALDGFDFANGRYGD